MTAPAKWPAVDELWLGNEMLAVYDFGTPPGGSAGDVVLLHGMADVARSLEPLAAALADRYRVVTFDARGHGRSTHPGAYSVLHHVADLATVLDARSIEHPIVIGHSLGGHTVANFAGLNPGAARGVVLLEGMGPPTAPADSPSDRHEHARRMVDMFRSTSAHRPRPSLDDAATRLRAVHPRLSAQRALLLAEEGTRPGPDGGRVWRHDPRTVHWVASVDHHANTERWSAIDVPVLAVSGAEAWDTWWARPGAPTGERRRLTAEEFAARLACFDDIEHVELAEAGHMVHFDQPDRVTELIVDFLTRRLSP